jgi:hypothetical protein
MQYLNPSFSVSYNAPGFTILRLRDGEWRGYLTIFDYQLEEFKRDHAAELEAGTMKIIQ